MDLLALPGYLHGTFQCPTFVALESSHVAYASTCAGSIQAKVQGLGLLVYVQGLDISCKQADEHAE